MATKTKKTSKAAKAKKVEKEMLIIDFCPVYWVNEFLEEYYYQVRELQRTNIVYWTKTKEDTPKKLNWFKRTVARLKKWFKLG